MRNLNKQLAGVVLAALMTPAEGEVFRWVDAEGRVNYGNRVPAGIDARVVPTATGSAAESSTTDQTEAIRRERQRRLLNAYDYDRQQRAVAEEQALRRQKAVGAHCRDLQTVWQQLSHAGPIYDALPDGERAYLDEQQRRERKAEVEREFAQLCPGALN